MSDNPYKYKTYPSLEDAVLTIILCERERNVMDAEGFPALLEEAWNYIEYQRHCFDDKELDEIARRQAPWPPKG